MRQYPWGTIQIENEDHCDFVKLREMLVRTNMEDLREKTHDCHYEMYRFEHEQNRKKKTVPGNYFEKIIRKKKKKDPTILSLVQLSCPLTPLFRLFTLYSSPLLSFASSSSSFLPLLLFFLSSFPPLSHLPSFVSFSPLTRLGTEKLLTIFETFSLLCTQPITKYLA